MTGALDGIRVVEFANYVSGPYAGMLLGDMGADIIKVEEPTKGDPFRGWGRVEYSPTFGSVNRNKKSVTLDLKSEQGKADARALILSADVVIENFRVGTMDRLGLGYDLFTEKNPGLIWCSITGFGSDGPYAMRPGYDTVGQAASGLLSLLTDVANPKPMGISLSDHLGGMNAANGIMAALMHVVAQGADNVSKPHCLNRHCPSAAKMQRAFLRMEKCQVAQPAHIKRRSMLLPRVTAKPSLSISHRHRNSGLA